jgi:hypothetical protein
MTDDLYGRPGQKSIWDNTRSDWAKAAAIAGGFKAAAVTAAAIARRAQAPGAAVLGDELAMPLLAGVAPEALEMAELAPLALI